MDKRLAAIVIVIVAVAVAALAGSLPLSSTLQQRADRTAPIEGYGDVTGDGMVSVYNDGRDNVIVHNYYVPYPDWDVNQDGIVDHADMDAISAVYHQTGNPHWRREDMNWDGVVGLGDLILWGCFNGTTPPPAATADRLTHIYSGLSIHPLTHDDFIYRADVNGDGLIDDMDVGLIIDYATGAIDRFPVQEGPSPPNADFTWMPENPLEGEEIQFIDLSTGDIDTWLWQFGDTHSSTLKNPTHAYIFGGNTYSVYLTVTGPGGGDTVKKYVTVRKNTTNLPPVANAGPDRTVILNQPVSFYANDSYDPDGYITRYFWDWGDGDWETTTEPHATHTYTYTNSPYGFYLTLRVTDNNGSTDSDTAHIWVAGGEHTLVISSRGGGGTMPAGGTYTYPEGHQVTVRATPHYGWMFDHWEGDITSSPPSSSNNPITIVMDRDRTVTAVFTLSPMAIAIQSVPSNGGYVTKTPDGPHIYGDAVTLTAVPATGYQFDHWEGDATGTHDTVTLIMDSSKNISACFTKTSGVVPLWSIVALSLGGMGAIGAVVYHGRRRP